MVVTWLQKGMQMWEKATTKTDQDLKLGDTGIRLNNAENNL